MYILSLWFALQRDLYKCLLELMTHGGFGHSLHPRSFSTNSEWGLTATDGKHEVNSNSIQSPIQLASVGLA